MEDLPLLSVCYGKAAFCTFYRALQIDPRQENDSNGRPIRLVTGGEAVAELF